MNRTAQRWLRRPWFSVLLMAALLFRALVPIGFMPGVGAEGRFTIILCPAGGHDLHGDMAAMGHMPSMAHHGDHTQSNCPFAGATAGMALVHAAPATVLLESLRAVIFFPPDQFVPRGTIVPTRLPRGPPSLA